MNEIPKTDVLYIFSDGFFDFIPPWTFARVLVNLFYKLTSERDTYESCNGLFEMGLSDIIVQVIDAIYKELLWFFVAVL